MKSFENATFNHLILDVHLIIICDLQKVNIYWSVIYLKPICLHLMSVFCLLLHAIADTIQAISVSGRFYWIKHKPYQTGSIGILNNFENKVLNQFSFSSRDFLPEVILTQSFPNIVGGKFNRLQCFMQFLHPLHRVRQHFAWNIFTVFRGKWDKYKMCTLTSWSKMHYDEAKLKNLLLLWELLCLRSLGNSSARNTWKSEVFKIHIYKMESCMYIKYRISNTKYPSCSNTRYRNAKYNFNQSAKWPDHSFADVLTSRKFSCIISGSLVIGWIQVIWRFFRPFLIKL